MTLAWRYLAVLAGLMTAALLLEACGGRGQETPAPIPTGIASPTAAAAATAEPEGTAPVRAEEAFEDVPLPEGAEELPPSRWTGMEVFRMFCAVHLPPGRLDVEAYTHATFKVYKVDALPDDVLEFYKNRRGSWEDVFPGGNVLFWTRDGGARVVVISPAEGDGTALLQIVEARSGE